MTDDFVSQTERIKKTYSSKFSKYGVDPRSLFWAGKGAAHQRFRQFWAEIDFTNKDVLDVGCGFGEFGKFILKRYEGVTYTGIDIVPEFIESAKKLVPKGHFEVRNLFNDPIEKKFDVVIASGILNSNLPAQAGVDCNMDYRKAGITKLFKMTKNILAFNMLGGHPQPITKKDSNVWYADSLEIVEYCTTLTHRVILRANYHPRDFTILLYR